MPSRTPSPAFARGLDIGPLPGLESKILFGAGKPGTNNIVGGHSPDVLTSPNYQMNEPRIVNGDGTVSVTNFKKIITRKDRTEGFSKAKSPNIHTIAPPSWTNAQVLVAGDMAGAQPGVVIRNVNGVKTTIHTFVVRGVEWQVVKDNGVVTSSFPTGGSPVTPGGAKP